MGPVKLNVISLADFSRHATSELLRKMRDEVRQSHASRCLEAVYVPGGALHHIISAATEGRCQVALPDIMTYKAEASLCRAMAWQPAGLSCSPRPASSI